ncbi:ABC transporter permease [Persicobacter sp. CCB-QB2]|uniref:ABC transporter permease n=1 Tax=Persicobacter sp. CCB-QB2 TaxID=1561025 RepID=UPI00155DB537|nr:ABC transporter permease [Persicobacter sp. CCB-QB2]
MGFYQFFSPDRKYKFYLLIAVFSLATGFSTAAFLFKWVGHEMNFDTFHQDAEHTYRLIFGGEVNGKFLKGSGLNLPLFEACKSQCPEITAATILNPAYWAEVEVENVNAKRFRTPHLAFVDSAFFSFFDFPLISGDREMVLRSPDDMVVSSGFAGRVFQGADPLGEQLSFFGKNWKVVGVFQDFPSNTHLSGDILIPYYGLDWFDQDADFLIYFKLAPSADPLQVAKKIGGIRTGGRYEKMGIRYELQPLSQIRFSTDVPSDFIKEKRQKSILLIIAIVGLLMLFISAIIYINLMYAVYLARTRVYEVKYILGAGRKRVFLEVLAEVVLTTIFSLLLAGLIFKSGSPWMEQHLGVKLCFSVFFRNALMVMSILIVLASVLPAVFIANRVVLQNGNSGREKVKVNGFQAALLILQFSVVLFLISGILIIEKQLKYALKLPLGYEIENTIFFHPHEQFSGRYDFIKQELLRHPAIAGVTVSNRMPFEAGELFEISTMSNEKRVGANHYRVKSNYFQFMGIPTYFQYDLQQQDRDFTTLAVNQKLLNYLDLAPDDDLYFTVNGQKFIGREVIPDILHTGYQAQEAQIYTIMNQVQPSDCFLIKFNQDVASGIEYVDQIWSRYSKREFQYKYLEDAHREQYQKEETGRFIFYVSMVLTLWMCFSGLLAMIVFTTNLRKKEVCIRKINGAGFFHLYGLLLKKYLLWLTFAILIAIPPGFFLMNLWLEGFAYRIALSPLFF